ncbi:MAG: glycosyltransferase family 2 protein [Bacillota bacterium]
MGSGFTSIIILTFNALPFTRECIESVRRFTNEPYELIVVDNGSSDGTAEYLQHLTGIKLIRNKTNGGYSRGNNQGIAVSQGEYVVFLNNDTVVTADWLKKLLTCIRSDSRIGAVGPKTNHLGNRRQVIKNPPYRNIPEMHLFAQGFGGSNPAKWENMPWLSGFCLLTSRRIINRVGTFDERFGLGLCEDNDFCLRLRKAGYRLVCAGDTFIHHFQSRTFKENGMDRGKMLKENLVKLRAKWPQNGC